MADLKQSDPLRWQQSGSLPRPGWIGRAVRLALAGLCAYVLYELVLHWQVVISRPLDAAQGLAIAILAMLWVFNYVVNIGFGVSWRRWPLIVLAVLFVAASALSRLAYGDWFGAPDGVVLLAALGYFYTHLGISFLLAGLFATPGCEMRALPHVWRRIHGNAAAEHHCPAGFLHRLDQWEAARQGS